MAVCARRVRGPARSDAAGEDQPGHADIARRVTADRDAPGGGPAGNRADRGRSQAALRLAAAARGTESDACRQVCEELVMTLSFSATVSEVFGAAQDHLVTCLQNSDHEIVDDLAEVRHAMKVNTGLAHRLLEQYRQRRGIGNTYVSR